MSQCVTYHETSATATATANTGPTSRLIVLTPEERDHATEIGHTRHRNAVAMHLHQAAGRCPGTEQQELQMDAAAAGAELAAAKALGLEWLDPNERFHDLPDIDPFVEVRYTPKPTSRLILRPADVEACEKYGQRAFVLVTRAEVPYRDACRYLIHGWLWADDREDRMTYGAMFAGDRRPPCWWANRPTLRDLSGLLRALRHPPAKTRPKKIVDSEKSVL
jgi:hypothetical protein